LLLQEAPSKIFVFYQPRDFITPVSDSPSAHVFLRATREPGAAPTLQEGEALPGTGEPGLFTSLGGDDRVRGKTVYFLRANGSKGVPDFENRDGSELLVGELTPDVLGSLQAQMTEVFQPVFIKREDAAEWGKAEQPHVSAFKASLAAFTDDMHEAIDSLEERVQLMQPDASIDLEAAARDITRPSRLLPDTIRAFETLLESWCSTIEGIVGDREKANTLAALAEQVPHTAGPRGITAYWRSRMQKLTSITEQLKAREMKVVISVMMSLVGKSGTTPVDAARSGTFLLVRRWKADDVMLTEAANEARDNVKYLSVRAHAPEA
jgi:dynein heavy chain, axonemal